MASPRLLSLSAATGLLVCLVAPGTAVAAPVRPDPPIVVTPRNPSGTAGAPSVGVGVRDAGGPGGPARGGPGSGGQGGAGGGGQSACRWVLAPDVEQFIRRLPAQLSGGVGPGRVGRTGGSPQDNVDPASRLYQQVCNGAAGQYAWSGQPAAAAAPVLPTAAELAQDAYSLLRLPVPTPDHSPDLRMADGRSAVLVGEHTWVWTDRSRFRPQAKRLQVGPVWAQVVASPVGLTFDPGNGDRAVSCAGPGTPFTPGRAGAHAASPTCDYQYLRSSAGAPGDVVTAEYGITWQVRWTGATGAAPAGGELPDMTSRTTTTFVVAEAQALGTTN